jgi:hypothetical protein
MRKKQQPVPAGPATPGGILLRGGDEFLDTAKSAEFLDRSPATLEYWRATLVGPRYFRQGRRVRYLKSDLVMWALRHPVEPCGATAA